MTKLNKRNPTIELNLTHFGFHYVKWNQICFEKQVINNVMKKEDESLCLGVLDIYGFEMIKVSSV